MSAGITRRRGVFAMEVNQKFLEPLFAGDFITNHVTLESTRPTGKPGRGVVITSHAVKNHRGEAVIGRTSARTIRTRAFVEEG